MKQQEEMRIVKVGTVVKVMLMYDGEQEDDEFTITDNFKNYDKNVISVDSPLAKCIAGQGVGFKGSYTVNGNVTKVEILEILK